MKLEFLKGALSKVTTTSFWKSTLDIVYLAIGAVIGLPAILVYIVITLPAIIYYHIILAILSRRVEYQRMAEKGFGTVYGLEYLSSVWCCRPSKNTILAYLLIDGDVSYEDCFDTVKKNWTSSDGKAWKHPELRQYLDSWMGYMYWREDQYFELRNHIKFHQVPESTDFDAFVEKLFDDLYNQPFTLKRSPWEVHMIHGWKHKENEERVEVSMVLLRMHHILGDAGTIRKLLFEDLTGHPLEEVQKTKMAPLGLKAETTPEKIFLFLEGTVGLIRDLGFVLSYALLRVNTRTRFHVQGKDNNKSRQVSCVFPSIPMEKVKCIRKKFGVSVTGVLISAFAAAIADSLNDRNYKNFLLATPRPLPNFVTGKLQNQITITAARIPIQPEMHPVNRLIESDEIFKRVTKSLFSPYLLTFFVTLLSFHIAPVARFGFRNPFGASLSNNWGPTSPFRYQGRNKVLEVGAAVGPFGGSTGIVLTVTSYHNQLRFQAVAENSVISGKELRILIDRVLTEINILHEMSLT